MNLHKKILNFIFIYCFLSSMIPMAQAEEEAMIKGNIAYINNHQYYLYGYYYNGVIQMNSFLYDTIDNKFKMHFPYIRSSIQAQNMFAYGFEIVAKDLIDADFESYWKARLSYPIIEPTNNFLYEHRTIKGVLEKYKKSSYSYQLYLRSPQGRNILIYIPKKAFGYFKFKKIDFLLGQELYAVSALEYKKRIVMQIHHPNQLVFLKNNKIQHVFEKALLSQ